MTAKRKENRKRSILANSKYFSLDAGEVREALGIFGVDPSEALLEAVSRYAEKLLLWNQRVNLTSITDPRELLERHFGESFFGSQAMPGPGKLVDVGSGAGFPGLALKLLRPELGVVLVEPNVKKATFLSELIRELDLKQVEVVRQRISEIDPSTVGAQYVTARAVGALQGLLQWAHPALVQGGRVILWLGAIDAAKAAEAPGWEWRTPLPIPRSRQRVLLIGIKP